MLRAAHGPSLTGAIGLENRLGVEDGWVGDRCPNSTDFLMNYVSCLTWPCLSFHTFEMRL